MSNDRDILLKLHRLYSRDETVQFLRQELGKAQVQNGKDTAYIAQLEDQLKELIQLDRERTEQYKQLQEQLKKLQNDERLKKEQGRTAKWRISHNNLLQKYHSLVSVMRKHNIMPESEYYKYETKS